MKLSRYGLAETYARLGDKDQDFAWLESLLSRMIGAFMDQLRSLGTSSLGPALRGPCPAQGLEP